MDPSRPSLSSSSCRGKASTERRPPEPRHCDEVLAAVAHRYRPGDQVGVDEVLAVIAIPPGRAAHIERWARDNGAWPYLRPTAGAVKP